MDYMDLTLSAHKTAANMLAMVEAASQMTITTVLFVHTQKRAAGGNVL